MKLINPGFNVKDPSGEKRVYYKFVQGLNPEIASWIETNIPKIQKKFPDLRFGDFAILARSNNSAKLIKENFKEIPIQFREETPLDALGSPWAIFFGECIYTLLDPRLSFNELFEKYIDFSHLKSKHKRILSELIKCKASCSTAEAVFSKGYHDIILGAASTLIPNSMDAFAVIALREVLTSEVLFDSYRPPNQNSVQVSTIHKSKGLEYGVVFHVDLYQWIIPSYDAIKGDKAELIQSLNLHYVGITRAKNACILISSSQRVNATGRVMDGQPSEFLLRDELSKMRVNF